MIENPVERCRAEDRVYGFGELKLLDVRLQKRDSVTELWPQMGLRHGQHVGRTIDGDDMAGGKLCEQLGRQTARAAAGVDNGF
jgi:hypothetical protein